MQHGGITLLGTRTQRIDLRRLHHARHVQQHERGQHSDGGNEPGGVRHVGLSTQSDVVPDPILPLAVRRFNAEALTFQQIGTSLAQTGQTRKRGQPRCAVDPYVYWSG